MESTTGTLTSAARAPLLRPVIFGLVIWVRGDTGHRYIVLKRYMIKQRSSHAIDAIRDQESRAPPTHRVQTPSVQNLATRQTCESNASSEPQHVKLEGERRLLIDTSCRRQDTHRQQCRHDGSIQPRRGCEEGADEAKECVRTRRRKCQPMVQCLPARLTSCAYTNPNFGVRVS